LIKFSIAAIDIDDAELRSRYDEIGMEQIAKIKNAQADKAVFGVLGEDWSRQQTANILTNISVNPGAGGVAAAGAGLGMGMAAGGMFGNMSQQMFSPMNPVQQQPVTPQPSGQFQQRTATEEPPKEDPVAKIKQLKEMLDLGVISQAEFDAKKQEILSRM
jgi:membrane protease subunit (stomatin/prohibitin family)